MFRPLKEPPEYLKYLMSPRNGLKSRSETSGRSLLSVDSLYPRATFQLYYKGFEYNHSYILIFYTIVDQFHSICHSEGVDELRKIYRQNPPYTLLLAQVRFYRFLES